MWHGDRLSEYGLSLAMSAGFATPEPGPLTDGHSGAKLTE